MKIVAIIPARGGSKRLPRKNILPLCGKPLIAYTIESSLSSTLINKTIVSTDDNEIINVAKEYGAYVIKRPKSLAKDNSPTIDAVVHAINYLEKRNECFGIIVLLEPTSPLRKVDDIDNALSLFLQNYDKVDMLTSLGEVHLENPYILKKITNNGLVKKLIQTKTGFIPPKVYFPYGVIYAWKVEALKQYKTLSMNKVLPYFIERWQNYEIDDVYDFMCVEAIMKGRK